MKLAKRTSSSSIMLNGASDNLITSSTKHDSHEKLSNADKSLNGFEEFVSFDLCNSFIRVVILCSSQV